MRSFQRTADRARSPGERAQAEQKLAAIRATEPPRDFAVARCVEAWCDLSTTRGIGMATGPIPWTAIVRWCEFHELDREATMIVVHVIRTLDVDRAEDEQARRAVEDQARARKAGRR